MQIVSVIFAVRVPFLQGQVIIIGFKVQVSRLGGENPMRCLHEMLSPSEITKIKLSFSVLAESLHR